MRFGGTLIYRAEVDRATMTEQTMEDVDHTPPNRTSAAAVWERGGEVTADVDVDADADSAAPADD